jgi:hypothetical protein
VAVFKNYLHFAETQMLETSAETTAGVSTLFEEEVAEFLRQAGHSVEMKVGTAGFFIDLAIANPAQTGAYLLGIECDGPEYNRARTARDRDRLRQQVLEGLGWRVHRLWSVEWFAHPNEEQARLLAAVEAARDGKPVAVAKASENADRLRGKRLEELRTIRREATSAKLTGALSQPAYQIAKPRIQLGNKELVERSSESLGKWVAEIVQIESPVHRDEVYDRLLKAADKRPGARNAEAFEKGVAQAVADQAVRLEGDFLFDAAATKVVVRDRRKLDSGDRKFELVDDVELDAAILMAVGQSYGIEAEDISIAASRLLGFDRTLEPMRQRVDQRVAAMLADGRLVERDEQIHQPD